jgi:hypothetical protein
MSLIDMLNNSLNQYNDTSDAWSQFIKDHKTYLRNNATTYTISSSYMQGYLYDLKRYLRAINYDQHCAWIVAWINDLINDVAFDASVTILLIPSVQTIQELYTTYLTTQSNHT